MKKPLKFLAIAFIAVLALSSCGVSNNLAFNLNLNNTEVVLSQANFKVVGTVNSSVTAKYIFGIGGNNQRAMEANAVAELTQKANLTGSQALVNVTVHRSSKTVLFIETITFYAEGTVIEFTK